MSVIRNVGNFFKNNTGRIVRCGIGLGALGAVAYDANYVGKINADLYSSEKDAAAAVKYLNNTMYNSGMSKINENIRESAYNTELDWTFRRFVNEGRGYIKGFGSMLVTHVVPLALGIGAMTKNKIVSVGSVIGLGVYGLMHLIRAYFGVGNPKNHGL